MQVVNYIEDNYGVQVKPLHLPELDNCLAMFTSEVARSVSTGMCSDADITWVSLETLRKLVGASDHPGIFMTRYIQILNV